MNINLTKEEISKHLKSHVQITVYGLRNKVNKYDGILYKTYPNIFTILTDNKEISFTYRDVITKEVRIKYLPS